MNKPLSPQQRLIQQQRSVNEWNARHSVGTPVIVIGDDGKPFRTKTRSDAWLVGGHTAVINLQGITGAYRLDRVTADAPAPLPEAA